MHISFLKKKKKVEWICGNGIAKIGGKKKFVAVGLWQSHCRNRGKKFVAIVAMPLPKMGEKKNSGCRNLWRNLKKKVLRPQYFYNKSHVISYY